MYEIPTPVGEIRIVREKLHGSMLNCLVTPYENPDNWFFKQFPSKEAVENWALDNHFTFKDDYNVSGTDYLA